MTELTETDTTETEAGAKPRGQGGPMLRSRKHGAAIPLVDTDRRARAMSIVTGGLTVAIIVGLPLGTVLGQHLGWRSAFWTVAILCTLAMSGVLATVPGDRPDPARLPGAVAGGAVCPPGVGLRTRQAANQCDESPRSCRA